jgi:hypothetical protein
MRIHRARRVINERRKRMTALIKHPKRTVVSVIAAMALAVGVGGPLATAAPVITGGLVNLTIVDVLNDNVVTVQVPVTAAAAVCGVQVGVISALGQAVSCTPNSGNATATA